MDDPWGPNDPPAPHPDPPDPLPPQLAKLAALTTHHVVAEGEDWENAGAQALPEVAALLVQGWGLVDGDPRYLFLAAIWPPELRCWLPDRVPLIGGSFDGRTSLVFPADQSCLPEHQRMDAVVHEAEAAAAGLPVPPSGRIWLLKSPWPWLGLNVVLTLFSRRAAEQDNYDAPAVTVVAREMLQWDETQLRGWWTGEDADAALAWEEQERIGEEVAELVRAGIGPDVFARLPGLTGEQAASWRWAVAGENLRDAVDRVVFFRSSGFPENPPENLYRLHGLTIDDIAVWLAAGFDVPAMVELIDLTVDQAITWRQHGYSPTQTRLFLQADRSVTAAEVDAFTAAGIVGRHQYDWIRHGFAAAAAVAYDELDIQPNEARVWRSMGLGPADARPGQHLPDGYELGGWIMSGGTRMRDVDHSVADPAGTRGEVAAQRREVLERHRGRRPRYIEFD